MNNPLDILQQYWGFPKFREPQSEIVDAVLAGKDILALLPTGGGKSICFQVPGLILDGLTLVISPLIALMRDQVHNLNRRGIPATYINSSMDFRQIDKKLQGAINGQFKFLYVAPERLKTEMFRMRLSKLNIQLLAIDEAHCISQWGYDFRPAYLEIGELRASLPNVPVIALTASATLDVKEDILDRLKMVDPKVFTKSFRRENLAYRVLNTENTRREILNILEANQGSGIIYTRTRRRTIMIADFLYKNGISAAAYHGGMSYTARSTVQENWINNKTRVIASTNAFGMGIDKPDVRFVIHYNLPQDLESYYQEAGRAGRDGKPAVAIAFNQEKDKTEVWNWVGQKYPPFELVEEHFNALMRYFRVPNVKPVKPAFNIDLLTVAKKCGFAPGPFYHSIRLLHTEGVLSFDESPEKYGRVIFNAKPARVLEFKRHNPDKANLIDFILRQAGGSVYSDDYSFFLKRWAGKLMTTEEVLHRQLEALKNSGIISYYPPREKPVIFFLRPKHKLTRTELSWHRYNLLKDMAFRRLKGMMAYIESDKGCRSAIIQSYFGEENPGNCGICDLCMNQKAGDKGSTLFRKIEDEIKESLLGQSMPYQQLIHSLSAGQSSEREKVVRYLLDHKILILEKGVMLSLNGQ